MRKLYLIALVFSALLVNSYVSDNASVGDLSDGTARYTHLYPNPATSYINFTFDKLVDKNYTLQIFNFIGRKMTEVRISDAKLTITLDDNYLRGLYIYQLRDQSGRIIESGKFQVNK